MNTYGSEIVERALAEREQYDGTLEEWLAEWDYVIEEMEIGNKYDAWVWGGYLVHTCHNDWQPDCWTDILKRMDKFTEYAKENGLMIGEDNGGA